MSEDKKILSDIGLVIAALAVFAIIISIVATNLVDSDPTENTAFYEKKVMERIKPLGEVATTAAEAKVASPEVEEPAPVVASGPQTGEQIYNTACMACHTSGAAGAPKIGDAAAWAPRIAQGLDVLFEHAVKGFKGMPPRGGSQLSDEEITMAIKHMVGKSK